MFTCSFLRTPKPVVNFIKRTLIFYSNIKLIKTKSLHTFRNCITKFIRLDVTLGED